jgi:hypothetical protein
VRVALYATIAAAIWIAASLVASWIVYDRSPLMRWEWIDRALGFRPDAWINRVRRSNCSCTFVSSAWSWPASWS